MDRRLVNILLMGCLSLLSPTHPGPGVCWSALQGTSRILSVCPCQGSCWAPLCFCLLNPHTGLQFLSFSLSAFCRVWGLTFNPPLWHLLAGWPWASLLPSLSLVFFRLSAEEHEAGAVGSCQSWVFRRGWAGEVLQDTKHPETAGEREPSKSLGERGKLNVWVSWRCLPPQSQGTMRTIPSHSSFRALLRRLPSRMSSAPWGPWVGGPYPGFDGEWLG